MKEDVGGQGGLGRIDAGRLLRERDPYDLNVLDVLFVVLSIVLYIVLCCF